MMSAHCSKIEDFRLLAVAKIFFLDLFNLGDEIEIIPIFYWTNF